MSAFDKPTCSLCQSSGTPHNPLINIADGDEGDVFVCDDTRACADTVTETAASLPYVLGVDLDDAPYDSCPGCNYGCTSCGIEMEADAP